MDTTSAFLSYLKTRPSAEAALLIERTGALGASKIALALATVIPEEHLKEFTRLVEAEDEAALGSFLDTHIPDMDTFITAALGDLRDLLEHTGTSLP